ncbi:MAG: hypothetical protein ACRDNG_04540 [Gaiellaceae bacterium]
MTAVAPLAPVRVGAPAGDRRVANPGHWSLLDVERAAPAARARAGARDRLDLEVELVAILVDASHREAVQADETTDFLLHPLFLLAP